MLTVLSQSTNDRNRDVAFLRLRERLPTWEAVMRRAGLRGRGGDPAGRDLQGQVGAHPGDPAAIAASPVRRRPIPFGSALAGVDAPACPLEQARDYLCALPGVGRKTAACVLLFSFGLRECRWTPTSRASGTRLRPAAAGAPFEQLHDQMLALTPPGEELELHVNLLRHGRRTCHARRPACGECALARMCPSRGLFA